MKHTISFLLYIQDRSAIDFMLDVIFLSSSLCPFGVNYVNSNWIRSLFFICDVFQYENREVANNYVLKFYDLFACDMSALDFMLLLIIFEV